MVRAVNDEFRFDFSGDLELRMNLNRFILFSNPSKSKGTVIYIEGANDKENSFC